VIPSNWCCGICRREERGEQLVGPPTLAPSPEMHVKNTIFGSLGTPFGLFGSLSVLFGESAKAKRGKGGKNGGFCSTRKNTDLRPCGKHLMDLRSFGSLLGT
jgi:hypothetical protein